MAVESDQLFDLNIFKQLFETCDASAFVVHTKIIPTNATSNKHKINKDHSTVVIKLNDHDCFHIDSCTRVLMQIECLDYLTEF